MSIVTKFLTLFVIVLSSPVFANTKTGKYFDRAIFVIFENTNYSKALRQPFFGELAKGGANFTNMMAITHPSQGNYIALTSGSLNGVKNDKVVDINVLNIVDLLEAKNVSWKVYAEDYPGNCFTGGSSGDYARKHNPFVSFVNIQKNPARCARIVNANEFDKDVAAGKLPEYVFYVPNNKNNGHDTGVQYADQWYRQRFSKFIADPKFMENTVLISTFDESGLSLRNQIYTSIFGPAVIPNNYNSKVNIYSLLKLIEDNWNLGDLGKNDAGASSIPSIWK